MDIADCKQTSLPLCERTHPTPDGSWLHSYPPSNSLWTSRSLLDALLPPVPPSHALQETAYPHLETASVNLPVLAAEPPPLTLEREATCTLDTLPLALRRHPGPASYSAANSTGPPPSSREEQPPPDSSCRPPPAAAAGLERRRSAPDGRGGVEVWTGLELPALSCWRATAGMMYSCCCCSTLRAAAGSYIGIPDMVSVVPLPPPRCRPCDLLLWLHECAVIPAPAAPRGGRFVLLSPTQGGGRCAPLSSALGGGWGSWRLACCCVLCCCMGAGW